jgi:hypothetical protein
MTASSGKYPLGRITPYADFCIARPTAEVKSVVWRLLAHVNYFRIIRILKALCELGISSGSIDVLFALVNRPSLPQQSDCSALTCAAEQKRVSQGSALNDLARPLVGPCKLGAHGEICTALYQ